MIELDHIITNGYISQDTIASRAAKGWKFVVTVPAIIIHPHAAHTDKVTIFSKYISIHPNENTTASNESIKQG